VAGDWIFRASMIPEILFIGDFEQGVCDQA
jgi:hypothetical protein